MASCGPRQANDPWLWRAMAATGRHGLAWHVGDRRRQRAQRRWAKRPRAARQHAVVPTAQEVVDAGGIPAAPPRAISKRGRTTHPLARFTHPRRQRVSRLVRAAWSCSTTLATHSAARTRGICHHNLLSAAASSDHDMDITTYFQPIPHGASDPKTTCAETECGILSLTL
jgi:hypothetical protein